MKIAVFGIEHRETPAFEGLKTEHNVVLVKEPLRKANASTYLDAEIVSTFIYSELNRAVLEQLLALKLIATRSTGFDHIDTAYCVERGIIVSNVPSYGENTVAEHVFALLLALSHRVLEAVERAPRNPFQLTGDLVIETPPIDTARRARLYRE